MRIRITIELEVDDNVKARHVQTAAHDAAHIAAEALKELSNEDATVIGYGLWLSPTRRDPS